MKQIIGFSHNSKAMEPPREYKHLGNPPGQKSEGEYERKWGLFRKRPNAYKFRLLFNTGKKGNTQFTREEMADTKPRTSPSSARQIYGKVPAKIFNTLFCKSTGRRKQNNERFAKIWEKLTWQEGHVHASHFGKMQKPKLIVLSCTGKIIGFTICSQCMHSDCTRHGLYLEAWGSRHSNASSSRK